MAQDGREALASQDYEAPRIENKRKFNETVNRNWNGGKAGLPAAPVPSCNNLRPPLTEFDVAKQSIVDIVANHFARYKRSRTEEAAEDQSNPIRTNGLDLGAAFADNNFKCVYSQPAKETLPMHHQQFHQGAHCSNRGGSNQAEKVDVPNLKAVAGGAGVFVALEDGGVRMSHDKVTVSMDLRVLNQFSARPFTIKLNPESSNVEFCWGQGGV